MAKKMGLKNRQEMAVAKREAKAAPKNTTGMGKNSPDAKGPAPKAFMSKKSLKMPKGCGK